MSEPYEGPFKTTEVAALVDVPMGEFWTGRNGAINPIIPAAARAAGHRIVGGEAFTGRPNVSRYTEDPAFLKPTAVGAFASSVNRFVLHHWVQQPFDDKYQPGMSMGWWGTHFSRFQTWAEPGKAFISWISRCQSMLQYGEEVADYLCIDSLQGFGDLISQNNFLKENIRLVNGNIVLQSDRSYPFIVLPTTTLMLPEMAQKIKQLVKDGATVVGAKAVRSPSLKNYPSCDSIVASIASELWGTGQANRFGKGYVYFNLGDALSGHSITGDYIVKTADTPEAVKVIHRTGKEGEVYFVTNLSKKPQRICISFRIQNKQPELWQPEDSSISNASVWHEEHDRTVVDFNLKDYQAVFVVFRKSAHKEDHLIAVDALNANNSWDVKTVKEAGTFISTSAPLTAVLKYASGRVVNIQLPGATVEEIKGPWNVLMKPKLDSVFTVSFPSLIDFSSSNDRRIRYFAGTANYSTLVQIDAKQITQGRLLRLDLGKLEDIVSIKVNGKYLGVLWYPPYVADITKAIKAGRNTIEISVTNNWANRLIGDEQEPADFEWGTDRGANGRAIKAYPDWFLKNEPRPSQGRKTFSTWHYFRKDSPLQPAGLIGPVKLLFVSTKKL
jgi:hypothetical protein